MKTLNYINYITINNMNTLLAFIINNFSVLLWYAIIISANGMLSPVVGSDIIPLLPYLTIPNILFVISQN